MIEPTDAPCGHVFERTEIEKKLLIKEECPLITCGMPLKINELRANVILKRQIERFELKEAKTESCFFFTVYNTLC